MSAGKLLVTIGDKSIVVAPSDVSAVRLRVSASGALGSQCDGKGFTVHLSMTGARNSSDKDEISWISDLSLPLNFSVEASICKTSVPPSPLIVPSNLLGPQDFEKPADQSVLFRVSANNKTVVTAGGEDLNTLSVIVNWTFLNGLLRQWTVDSIGTSSRQDGHGLGYTWLENYDLNERAVLRVELHFGLVADAPNASESLSGIRARLEGKPVR